MPYGLGLQGGVGSERFTRRSHSSLESHILLYFGPLRPLGVQTSPASRPNQKMAALAKAIILANLTMHIYEVYPAGTPK